jgi:hypothetical protein
MAHRDLFFILPVCARVAARAVAKSQGLEIHELVLRDLLATVADKNGEWLRQSVLGAVASARIFT